MTDDSDPDEPEPEGSEPEAPGPEGRGPEPEESEPDGREPGQAEGDAPSPGVEESPEPPSARRRLIALARRRPILASVLAVLAAAAGLLLVLLLTLPSVEDLRTGWPERTAFMRGWLESADEGARISYQPVTLARIPASVRRAVLVSEDAAFYGHRGFDWHEVQQALREAWEERELPRGASTISQQLARNLYLSPSRDPVRKFREALITRRLEAELSKDRILELYLNVLELGRGTFGVEAASRRYFGRSVSAVSPREAAELAATIPSPRRHNPETRTRTFLWRAGLIERRAFGPARESVEAGPEVRVPLLEPRPPAEGEPPTPDSAPAPDSTQAPGSAPAADTVPARPDTVPSAGAPAKKGAHLSSGERGVNRLTTTSSPTEMRTPGITM